MPLYYYKCDKCMENFEARHSYKTVLNKCSLCGVEGHLSKVLTPINYISKENNLNRKKNSGQEVVKAIKDAATDLNKQKEDLQKRRK